MVVDVSLMLILLQTIVVFLILLVISFAVPKLQPLLYTSIFFFFLLYVLTTIVFPFSKSFANIFEALPDPFAKLLIGSAILYYISELITGHMAEAGYSSLATLANFAVKIAILSLWMKQITQLIEILSTLIIK
ncbi:SpoIIIAC/SpoIIIAD family protein [Sporosarcina sp. YIM B06819]|uniref:SpoIIIAC/SpoIIIAD family protein n=1 Tax=Sporosarcina sp. YIM B06819 TaxID=3081769 RepID=UPI00298C48F6|nr:SpoIIIAC/SpoIIIAD family protein [Sporosarcina sp. YIM B06819]